jgi:hypothetical protein
MTIRKNSDLPTSSRCAPALEPDPPWSDQDGPELATTPNPNLGIVVTPEVMV